MAKKSLVGADPERLRKQTPNPKKTNKWEVLKITGEKPGFADAGSPENGGI